jgi:hypothetical protein
MANEQACPAPCEEVFDVENKWPYLPITPTYDQYVQRWVVMPEREGFHLKTRSAMKELLEDVKWMVLNDKFKKRTIFKIRVDLWQIPPSPSMSIVTGCAPDGLVANSCTARGAIFPQIDFWGYINF